MANDEDAARSALHLLGDVLGKYAEEALGREGMAETPLRMAKALRELTSGYGVDVEALLKTFPAEYEPPFTSMALDPIVVRDIPFASLCEHHVLPFHGTVAVAYVPRDVIVGLSKIPRLVDAYARRLQVQERLTRQIAEAMRHINPRAVAVVVKGVHECASLRGVEKRCEMVTQHVCGEWTGLDRRDERAEILRRLT